MTRAHEIWVFGTKWKVLSASTAADHGLGRSRYGLSQTDFYPLFAYGHKYLNRTGDLLCVYPQTKSFTKAPPPFRFAHGLKLWVAPFDLALDLLVAAPGGLPVSTYEPLAGLRQTPRWGS